MPVDQISFTPNPDAKATYTYSDKTRATSTVGGSVEMFGSDGDENP